MLTCLRDCLVERRPLASSHLRGKIQMAVTLVRHSAGPRVNTEEPGTSRSLQSSQSTGREPVSPQASPVHYSQPLSEELNNNQKTSEYTGQSTNNKEHAHNSQEFTLNCMTQPLPGIMSCVTASTSCPSVPPHTITPSGELQKRLTEQSSENSQWSLTDRQTDEKKRTDIVQRTSIRQWSTFTDFTQLWFNCFKMLFSQMLMSFTGLPQTTQFSRFRIIVMKARSHECDVIPTVSSWWVNDPLWRVWVLSAGALSWLGRATPLNVSEIWAWASDPEIRTLSRAQSPRSAPSCWGCHQRIRTPSARAAGGSSTFTNLQRKCRISRLLLIEALENVITSLFKDTWSDLRLSFLRQ